MKFETFMARAVSTAAHGEGPPISQGTMRQSIDSMVSTLAEAINRGESVTIPGFGTFKPFSKGTTPGQDLPLPDDDVKVSKSEFTVAFKAAPGFERRLSVEREQSSR